MQERRFNSLALQNKLNLRSFLPSFDISFTSSRIANLHAGDSDSLKLGFNLNQPVFDGGRSLEALRLAEIQLNLQAAALEKQYRGIARQRMAAVLRDPV